MRIVSFLPGATEVVYALGLGDDLHGVTHECDYPPQAREKPRAVCSLVATETMASGEIDAAIGDRVSAGEAIYQIDADVLAEARPDLVLTQGLCEVCAVPISRVEEAVEGLSPKPQVLSLDPHSLGDLFTDIQRLGEATGSGAAAGKLVASLEVRRERVASRAAMAQDRPKVLCLEWLDPLITAGHWVPEMVDLAGGEDCFGRPGQPSAKVEWEQVVAAAPEVVVAMACGFDVRRGISDVHLVTEREGWDSLPAARNERLVVADGGAYFSRCGPRLLDGLETLAEILHPELFSGLVAAQAASRIYGRLFKVS